ncbi:hypothetical protein BCR44DRAFT_1059085 [Catenaria anguillulae PL171]|uniref:RRM domain-containing protein n=1 Tax=Catenaria anguillulae PL171 TaxID=765915 RepID=A0A1Y2HQ75_9FUNG|nr:hypothetical protein BCR44DRAFT_1059085 [Catenaria anguillulae PL171]
MHASSHSYSPTDPRFTKALQQGYRAHDQDYPVHARQHAAAAQEAASTPSYLLRGQYPYDTSMGSSSPDTDQLVLQNQVYSMESYQPQTGSATEAYLRQHYQQQQEYDEANKLRAQMSSSPAMYQSGIRQQQQQQQQQQQNLGYPGASPQMGPSDAPSPGLSFGQGYYQREAGANGFVNTSSRSWSASEEQQYTLSLSPSVAPTSRTASWTMGHERLAVTLPPPSPDHSSPASLYARRGVPLPSLRGDTPHSGGGEFTSYPSVPDRPFPSYLPSLASSHSPQLQHIRRAPQGKPPKVFVSYLPPVYTVDDVARLFSPYGTIVSIKLLPTPNESLLPLKYRCGFVQFDRDTAVGACIHALHQFHLTLEGKRYILTVRNASDQAPVNNTNLMVKGLPNDMPEQRLFDTFSQFGRVTSCRIMRDRDRTSSDASMHLHQYPQQQGPGICQLLDCKRRPARHPKHAQCVH